MKLDISNGLEDLRARPLSRGVGWPRVPEWGWRGGDKAIRGALGPVKWRQRALTVLRKILCVSREGAAADWLQMLPGFKHEIKS